MKKIVSFFITTSVLLIFTVSNILSQTPYASLPFTEHFDSAWINGLTGGTRDIPSKYWVNSPVTTDSSWSRDDDGFNRDAWISIYGTYNPSGANGTIHSARFHSYNANYGTSGTLDLHINFSKASGNTYLSFWYINIDGTDSLRVYLSVDGGSTFAATPLCTKGTSAGWTNVVVSLGSITTATGVIRFKATSDDGYSDIGIDEVNVVAGLIANFTSNVIIGFQPLTVNFSDQSLGSPTSWKWYFNSNSIGSTSQNPTYVFNNPGYYPVKLVTSKTGSTDSIVKTNYITVKKYASLPYYESFDSTWVNGSNFRDIPSLSWTNTPSTGNNSWSRDDDGFNRAAWLNTAGEFSPSGANETPHSARFHAYYSYGSGSLDLNINFTTATDSVYLSFWYNKAHAADSLNVYLSTNGGISFVSVKILSGSTTGWSNVIINLGKVTSTTGVIRFYARGSNEGNDIGIDEIKVNEFISNFKANITTGASPLTVNFTDMSEGSPTKWKWYFNDSIEGSAIQNPTYIYNTGGTYSVKLISSNTGNSDSIVKTNYIRVNAYASLPYYESFDSTWINNTGTRDVPSQNWVNTPSSGNNSWRRDDDGASAGWLYPSSSGYFPSGAKGSKHSARFHSCVTRSSGTLDLYINFSTGSGNKGMSFWYNNNTGRDSLHVYLSTDGGNSFGTTALCALGTSNGWTQVVVNLGSITSTTGIIRFMATGDGLGSDIGIDEVKVGGVIANFSTNLTSGTAPLSVNFTDESTGTPTAWKWFFNNANNNNIGSLVQSPVYNYNKGGNYTVKLISSNADYTDSIVKTNYIRVNAYASLPYYEGFDSIWINNESTRDIPSQYWLNTPATGNNSWRRDNDGSAAAWGDSTLGSYSPAGINGTPHSARFHSYLAYNSGTLDLYINFSTASGNTGMSFWYNNASSKDSFYIYISTDGGNTFGTTALCKLGASNGWVKIGVNLGNITSATGVIRFMAKGYQGGSDIGIDEVKVGGLTADFTVNTTSGTAPLSATFTDQSTGSPTAWKWYFNDANNGSIGSVAQSPNYVYKTGGNYSVKMVASNAVYTDSIVKTDYVRVNAYAPLPYYESFDSTWINNLSTRDIPSQYWLNTPATGNTSWRRDDDGASASWSNAAYGYYIPAGAVGTSHSARFHSTYSNGSGSLDLYINFSTASGNTGLSFWYNNYNLDSLFVYLSTDGGNTFGTTALCALGSSGGWTKIVVNLGNVTSSTGVIRFKGQASYYYSDIGIDEVKVGGLIADYTVNTTSGTAPLSVNFTDMSIGKPTAWKWYFNNANNNSIGSEVQNPTYIYKTGGNYTVKLVTSNTASTDSMVNTDYIRVNAYASLPYHESFDSTWINNLDIKDIPSQYWLNTPATGTNSWRRDDEAYLGAWTDSSGGGYVPTGANGTPHSARFHSFDTYGTGTLDLYVNFSTATDSEYLSFWYINVSGTDSLHLYLSTDGGNTFGTVALIEKGISPEWSQFIVNLGKVISSAGVIRFMATGDLGSSDVGIDEVTISGDRNPNNISSLVITEQDVVVYPNPSPGIFNVKLPVTGHWQVEVTNLTGSILINQSFDTDGEDIIHLNISNLESGVYILRVISGEKTNLVKLIIR